MQRSEQKPHLSWFCGKVKSERGVKQGWSEENKVFFGFARQYLKNGTK